MTTPEINKLLAETGAVLETVRRHRQENIILLILAGIALVLACRYIWERWTFIPRKKHNRVFTEDPSLTIRIRDTRCR